MKKLLFFTILAFTAMNALAVEPVYYQNGRYFSVDAGFRRSALNAGQLGLDYIRGDKSPFHGYSYGLQIGCYF